MGVYTVVPLEKLEIKNHGTYSAPQSVYLEIRQESTRVTTRL